MDSLQYNQENNTTNDIFYDEATGSLNSQISPQFQLLGIPVGDEELLINREYPEMLDDVNDMHMGTIDYLSGNDVNNYAFGTDVSSMHNLICEDMFARTDQYHGHFQGNTLNNAMEDPLDGSRSYNNDHFPNCYFPVQVLDAYKMMLEEPIPMKIVNNRQTPTRIVEFLERYSVGDLLALASSEKKMICSRLNFIFHIQFDNEGLDDPMCDHEDNHPSYISYAGLLLDKECQEELGYVLDFACNVKTIMWDMLNSKLNGECDNGDLSLGQLLNPDFPQQLEQLEEYKMMLKIIIPISEVELGNNRKFISTLGDLFTLANNIKKLACKMLNPKLNGSGIVVGYPPREEFGNHITYPEYSGQCFYEEVNNALDNCQFDVFGWCSVDNLPINNGMGDIVYDND